MERQQHRVLMRYARGMSPHFRGGSPILVFKSPLGHHEHGFGPVSSLQLEHVGLSLEQAVPVCADDVGALPLRSVSATLDGP